MATTRINALAAVLAANLTDAAVFPVEDALSQTRRGTLAQLRTQLNAGAQSFTGAVTVGGVLTVSGLITAQAGQIAFPAVQNPSTNINTLDDYEEGVVGSWTPNDASGAGLAFIVSGCWYMKIGKMGLVGGTVIYPVTADANPAKIGGLPFAVETNALFAQVTFTGESTLRFLKSGGGTNDLALYTATPSPIGNNTLSGDQVSFFAVYQATA
ncbi:MAG TPA: hypothetical protein VNJ04_18405 [Gemmatimonadaceae bacterium]|nr:hypothetical protein [Gemmatimonadaceae bacterium]